MEQEHRMLDARILEARGYTQVQIAEMLKVTDRTVRNYLGYPPGIVFHRKRFHVALAAET